MKLKRWFYLSALFAVLIGLYPIIYFVVDRRFGLLRTKDLLTLQSLYWNIGFYTHIILGGLALLIGWTQFIEKWRISKPIIHRVIGKLYVIFVLLSAVSGFFISFYATGGWIASLGFMSLGIIWFLTTFFAFQYARKKNFNLHRKLMVYSYAACFAAVTLRIWLPLLTFAFQDFFIAYKIVAWLSWVPNIIAAYFINRRTSNLMIQRIINNTADH